MIAFDGLDRVIRIGSFSESPAAAVRCGNIAALPDWIEALADLLHGVLTDGSYRRHVETVRTRLARATARTVKRLRAIGIEHAACLFVWARLPVGDDAVVLARMALSANIVLAPGNVFGTGDAWGDHLRFNVAMCDDERIFAFLAKAM